MYCVWCTGAAIGCLADWVVMGFGDGGCGLCGFVGRGLWAVRGNSRRLEISLWKPWGGRREE